MYIYIDCNTVYISHLKGVATWYTQTRSCKMLPHLSLQNMAASKKKNPKPRATIWRTPNTHSANRRGTNDLSIKEFPTSLHCWRYSNPTPKRPLKIVLVSDRKRKPFQETIFCNDPLSSIGYLIFAAFSTWNPWRQYGVYSFEKFREVVVKRKHIFDIATTKIVNVPLLSVHAVWCTNTFFICMHVWTHVSTRGDWCIYRGFTY